MVGGLQTVVLGKAAAEPWTAAEWVVPPEPGKLRFADMDLPDPVVHAVADLDFKYCTPIQAMVLPHALKGLNVAGRAQTGTGKTAAFLVSIFTQWMKNPRCMVPLAASPRALVIAPTRELVLQILKDAGVLGKYCPFRGVAVFGGMDYQRQRLDVQDGVLDLVVATPGRLLDYLGQKVLRLDMVETLIIDEADRMLDMGFIPDVKRIIRHLPPRERRQTLLFSATLDESVMRLASEWMPDPVVLHAEPEKMTADSLEQVVWPVTSAEKFTVLYNLIRRSPEERILVFVNRRDEAESVGRALRRAGISCDYLSGDLDQRVRLRVLESFRGATTKVVVATDVAGRGLHIADIRYVVNYDLPYEADDYVHRIGRTGRAGAVGTAIAFACEDESFILPEIEKSMGCSLRYEQPDPTMFEPVPDRPVRAAVKPEPPATVAPVTHNPEPESTPASDKPSEPLAG